MNRCVTVGNVVASGFADEIELHSERLFDQHVLASANVGFHELFASVGVACLERLAFETLAELGAEIDDTIFSAGGGARSEAWCQIRADTLNKAVLCTRGGAATGAAMGAAILAASLERYGSVNEAGGAMVHVERAVEPRVDRLAAYAAKYEQFMDECYSRGYLTTTSLDTEFWEVLRPDGP